jgi:hypothetical protein
MFYRFFDVHGSVRHGKVYVQLKVQLDVNVLICILYSSLFLALHVSDAKSVRVSQPVPDQVD